MSRTVHSDAPSVPWLLAMSSWMLLTLIPAAATSWLGFGIVGVVSRKPRVIVLSVVFAGAAIVAALEVWGPWRPVAAAVVYLAGMLVALGVNPGWLRSMWERRSSRRAAALVGPAARVASGTTATRQSRAQRRAAASAASKKRAAAARAATAGTAAQAGSASAAEARKATARKADAPASDADALAERVGATSDDLIAGAGVAAARPDGPAAEPVDVNTADVDEIAALPGFTKARARKAVRARDQSGGFVSVEAFGEAVGLQPHELVRLRDRAVCSPRPRGERRFGRRVDL